MPENIFFQLGLSFILLHEMDAVRCKEWRIFPGLARLNDQMGYQVFIFAHIPLFGLLFWGLSQADPSGLILGMDLFFMVHVGLHLLMLRHPKNEFKDRTSWIIIIGAGLFGLLDILMLQF